MVNKVWSKEEIRFNLETKDNWLYRGIVAIYNNQTEDERKDETTRHLNNIGFNGCDAKIMSSFAKQINDRGFLSDKQKVLARKKMVKYSAQLSKIANRNN